MPNVYVSLLGTTDYKRCTYVFADGEEVPDVRFVQQATVKRSCSDWSESDRILILTTDRAHDTNWLDNGHGRSVQGLQWCLNALGLKPTVANVRIPEGRNEDEIWQIFQVLSDILAPGDNVTFDITHGFRSLPMLVMVLLNYARVMKDVTLAAIYYGAYEAPDENDRRPVFDLSSFDYLLQWSLAIDRFLKAGDASLAHELAFARTDAINKEKGDTAKSADAVETVARRLLDFSRDMQTCRGLSVSRDALSLKQAIRECVALGGELAFTRALMPLLNRVAERLEVFRGDEVTDGIAAARWCLDHGLVQQGYTILREILISHAAIRRAMSPLPGEERAMVEDELGQDWDRLTQDREERKRHRARQEASCAPSDLTNDPGVVKSFGCLANPRNDLNHAGYRKSPWPAKTFFKQLPKLIERFERIIESSM
jgi:CRISPR-associated Csx2 family protein